MFVFSSRLFVMTRVPFWRGGAAVSVASAPGMGVPTSAVGGTQVEGGAVEAVAGRERVAAVGIEVAVGREPGTVVDSPQPYAASRTSTISAAKMPETPVDNLFI